MPWVYDEDALREQLVNAGVPETEIKRWDCHCGQPNCETYVLYGVGSGGPPKADRIIQSGTSMPAHRVLWLVCSITSSPDDGCIVRGVDANDSIDAIWGDQLERRLTSTSLKALVEWSSFMAVLFDVGLRETLKVEHSRLRLN